MNMETKVCLNCGSDALVRLASLNTKKCGVCAHEQNWPLDPGQAPLVGSSRQRQGPGTAEEDREARRAKSS